MRLLWIYIGLFACLSISCKKNEPIANLSPTAFLNEHHLWADSILNKFSLEELFGQLIIFQSTLSNPEEEIQLEQWTKDGKIGGVILEDIGLLHYLGVKEKLQLQANVPMIWGTEEQVLLNNQFSDIIHIPTSIEAMSNDSLTLELLAWYFDQMDALGINLSLPDISNNPFNQSSLSSAGLSPGWAGLQDLRVIGIANTFKAEDYFLLSDTSNVDFIQNNPYQNAITQGASGFLIEEALFHHDSIARFPNNFLKDFFKEKLNFEGLLVVKLEEESPMGQILRAGVDLIVTDRNPDEVIIQIIKVMNFGQLPLEEVMHRVKKVLQAKNWMKKEFKILEPPKKEGKALQASLRRIKSINIVDTLEEKEKILKHFKHPYWQLFKQDVHRKSMVLVNNSKNLLPFTYTYKRPFRLLHYGTKNLQGFNNAFKNYADFSSIYKAPDEEGRLKAIPLSSKWHRTNIVTLSGIDLDTVRNGAFIESLNQLSRNDKTVLINFGPVENLTFLDTTLTIIQAYKHDEVNEVLAVEQLFGAITLKGSLNKAVNENFKEGTGIELPKVRLGYTSPESVGIAPEKLVGIDAIMKTAIRDGAFPGCQVLIAKRGQIIYSKAFGAHTYKKLRPVRKDDLYDVASITKVAGTTLAAMHLYEGKKLNVEDRVKQHWQYEGKSSIKNISIKKLMTHQSGLQPHMPVVPYLIYRDVPNVGCDSFFCNTQSDTFPIQVADSFFFKKQYIDQVWEDIHRLKGRRKTKYRYSDVNFMLLQKIIEEKTKEPLNEWLSSNIYYPLGLRRSTYNPLMKFKPNIIIPTQRDTRWRQQLVHGYVHDETAALFGGVGGHAGLFSNAEELAVLFQTLLNEGTYGGRRYFQPSTVRLFTSARHGNHRGLGFDKPSYSRKTPIAKSASSKTFGHTGFTGTCVWADPEHDLIFIFLSNRIYPNIKNRKLFRSRIRERAHQVVYDALGTYKGELPSL